MSKNLHNVAQFPESAILLQRIDPARNMRRFYRIDVQPDVFGGVLLMKQWGRIGSRGQCQTRRFEDAAAAYIGMHAQARQRAAGIYPARRVGP